MPTTEDEIEKRVRTLELQLSFLREAAYVTAACILAFLGYTLLGLPSQVTAKVQWIYWHEH